MTNRTPAVFVGSSVEGLPIAETIQLALDHTCEVTLWSQGVFGLGGGGLDALVKRLGDFDFAILVLTADDLIESRGTTQQSPRDNVLLELGLFIGHLGPRRTFAIYDRTTNIKIPSDLAGVTVADYRPHSSGNLESSLGAACTKIKNAIFELNIEQGVASEVEDMDFRLYIFDTLVDESFSIRNFNLQNRLDLDIFLKNTGITAIDDSKLKIHFLANPDVNLDLGTHGDKKAYIIYEESGVDHDIYSLAQRFHIMPGERLPLPLSVTRTEPLEGDQKEEILLQLAAGRIVKKYSVTICARRNISVQLH
ncbi:MAG: hypothetical protein GY835_22380 [bacterium]|nr:hypothetical protein [bacterium]